MLPISAFLFAMLVQVSLMVWGTFEVKRFLKSHSMIDGPESLTAFKTLARRNMYGALAVLVVGVAALVLSIFIIRAFALPGLGMVMGIYVPCLLLGLNLTRLERRARSLECSNQELMELHRTIGHSWRKKALPDF